MSRRNITVLAVVGTVAALAGFWVLLLAPKREEASRLDAAVAAGQARAAQAEAQVAQYTAAKDTYAANFRAVARLGKAVPADDDVRSLLVQLEAAARRSGVDFRTLSVDGGRAGGTPAPGATVPGAAATQAATATLPPGASVGPAGLGTMPFTFSFRGSFADLSGFFARLERFITVSNRRVSVTGRLLQLDALSLRPDSLSWPRIRAEVRATSYLVPATEGLFAGATPQRPASTTPMSVATADAGGAVAVASAGGTN